MRSEEEEEEEEGRGPYWPVQKTGSHYCAGYKKKTLLSYQTQDLLQRVGQTYDEFLSGFKIYKKEIRIMLNHCKVIV